MNKLIVSYGPALYDFNKLTAIHRANNIYRINGAQVAVSDVAEIVAGIRTHISDAEILLDLPGNKVRTYGLAKPITLVKGDVFEISKENFTLTSFGDYLSKGDVVWANDSLYRFEVVSVDGDFIRFKSGCDGLLGSNKGMHVRGISQHLPFLFDKDERLIEVANDSGIDYVGLSYVRDVNDLKLGQKLVSSSIKVLPKIETRLAVENLADILSCTPRILIDRGDLASDIGIEKLPETQEQILLAANELGVKVFLATQFLKNMERFAMPTIAEINDLYKTLKKNVYGIQLSEETAIGLYPEACVDLIYTMNKQANTN
jgi:pyruvate kinase